MSNNCAICLNAMEENDVSTTKCGHQFHTSCLITNTIHNPDKLNCPLCRGNLVSDDQQESINQLAQDFILNEIPPNLPYDLFSDDDMVCSDEEEDENNETIAETFEQNYVTLFAPHLTEEQLVLAKMHYSYFIQCLVNIESGEEMPQLPTSFREMYARVSFKPENVTQLTSDEVTEDVVQTPKSGDIVCKDGIVTAIVINRDTNVTNA